VSRAGDGPGKHCSVTRFARPADFRVYVCSTTIFVNYSIRHPTILMLKNFTEVITVLLELPAQNTCGGFICSVTKARVLHRVKVILVGHYRQKQI